MLQALFFTKALPHKELQTDYLQEVRQPTEGSCMEFTPEQGLRTELLEVKEWSVPEDQCVMLENAQRCPI